MRGVLARWAGAAVAVLALGWAPGARAIATLSDGELDGVRGGFVTAGGITFGFGAVEKTYIDGRLALLTTLTLGDTGEIRGRTTAGPGLSALDAALKARLGAAGGTAFNVDGAVTLVQGASANRLLNLVINTASHKVILQDTAVNLTLPGFAQLRQSAALAQMNSGLSGSLNAATVGAVTH